MVLLSFKQKKAFQSHPAVKRALEKQKSEKSLAQQSTTTTNPTAATSNPSTTPSSPNHSVNAQERDLESSPVQDQDRPDSHPPSSDSKVDPFEVTWGSSEDDDYNPQKWSYTKKWILTTLLAGIAINVGIGASINSASSEEAAQFFGVSIELMELQTAIYLIGFGLAAPIFGPLSELGGRLPVYCLTLFFFVIFEIGAGLSQTFAQRIVLRFFSGFFGSTPLSNAGGSLADIVNAAERTYFFPVFGAAGFMGPALGPVIGGYVGMYAGQEWCDYITAIWGAIQLILLLFLMPETFAPVLQKMKAQQIRKATGDSRYQTSLEKVRSSTPFYIHLRHAMAQPFVLTVKEPIVLFFGLLLTVVYIVLFSDFEAYSVIFQPFGLNAGEIGLTFISIAIGLLVCLSMTPFIYKRYRRKVREAKEEGKENPDPEERLMTAMIGSWLVPIGLFYQAWTSFDYLPVWPCISAGVLVGAGVLTCFISSYMYIIDVYQAGSASALASLTFIRYIISGAAVMWTRPMYSAMGNQWALTFLALLSLLFSAVPPIFYFYGPRIRSWSKHTAVKN